MDWIVCLGGEDWWYHSHGHFDIQLMKQFTAARNVLYICSIGMRMPSLTRDKMFWTRLRRKLRSILHLLKQVDTSLYVYSPLPLPFYGSRFGRWLNRIVLQLQLRIVYRILKISEPLLWINTPTAWPVAAPLPYNGLVYQRTDDYASYDFENFNAGYVKSLDIELMKKADIVIHVSDELHKEAREYTSKSLLVIQGVDERFFRCSSEEPADIKNIPRPIIGYVGGMDRYKFDTRLIYSVAEGLPDCSFVLIGAPNPNTSILEELSNVYFLGSRNHELIPDYVCSFDVCMVPTALTEWGLKCRPLKLMEYMATGRPVVASPTPASAAFSERVIIAEDVPSWIYGIRLALRRNQVEGPELVASAFLESWKSLAIKLWDEMCSRGLVECALHGKETQERGNT